MMNEYLELELVSNVGGLGGSFVAYADFSLDNFRTRFKDIEVKIDTGCSVSVIHSERLRIPKVLSQTKKLSDINANIPFLCSYGVETGGLKHDIPSTFSEKVSCEAMKFAHNISDLIIDGVKVPASTIHINYDRKSNILIGMDILSLMETHIGLSRYNGKLILLACPYGQIVDSFNEAIEKHFGLRRVY